MSKKDRFIVTKDYCMQEALKYKARSEFFKYSPNAYHVAWRKGWLSDVCKHMIYLTHPCGYWTLEKCMEESLKYKTRMEFKRQSSRAYIVANSRGWMDVICNHMTKNGNRYYRCIYAYEFPDNSVYVGLTYNLTVRDRERRSRTSDAVIIHKNKTGLTPELKQLTSYIEIKTASFLEGAFVDAYKHEGWNILNKCKPGGTGGGMIKWTKQRCTEEALKYSSKTEFMNGCWGAYSVSCSRKWLNEICGHMKPLTTPINTYTWDYCYEIAQKYNNRKELTIDHPEVMSAIYRNGWNQNACSHMKNMRGNDEMKQQNSEKFSKPVYQYTVDGVCVKRYTSVTSAAIDMGVTNGAIGNCCNPNDRHMTCRGYVWKFAD